MKALDEIILFDRDSPRRGYISSSAIHPQTASKLDGVQRYWVSSDLADASAGRGYWLDARKIKPYSETLWAACTEYLRRQEQLKQDLIILSRGKVPVHYYQQHTLFTGDHLS